MDCDKYYALCMHLSLAMNAISVLLFVLSIVPYVTSSLFISQLVKFALFIKK